MFTWEEAWEYIQSRVYNRRGIFKESHGDKLRLALPEGNGNTLRKEGMGIRSG